MSILVKGVRMPKDHNHVTITIWSNGAASYALHDRGESLVDFRNVEVISVPPHGRLGDLDSFALLVLNWISTQEKSYPYEDSNALAWRLGAKAMANQIYRDVKAYPTIITAEEGE